jgi:conjugal transfer pilus assembly protein TraD
VSRQQLRRYLALAAFLALLAAPGWTTPVVIALALGACGFRLARSAGLALRRRRAAPREQILLGREARGRPAAITERQLGAHGLIFGASGSGKTTALVTILEQQIRRGRPVVAIDMKGSPAFVLALSRAAAGAGRPFCCWTPEGPSHWNPLAQGSPTELKDKLIGTERFTEPHYQRAAERYLQSVFQVLHHAHPERPPTLTEVVALMDPRRLPARLAGLPRPLVERVQDYLASLTPDQLSAIRGLQTRLAIITESDSGRYLSPPDELPALAGGGSGRAISLPAALAGGEVVVFSLNSSRYGQFASQLGTLAVQDLIYATGRRLEQLREGRQLEQAIVAIDEFSGIGAGHVVSLFARGREAGVACLVATQEVADLDRVGRGVRDQILGNTALKLVLRQEVPESAELVAQMAGTEKVWEETRQIGGTLFRGSAGGGTRREAERFIIHPNEIKSLRTGEAVLIAKLGGGRARQIRLAPPPRSSAEAGRPARGRPYPDPGVTR